MSATAKTTVAEITDNEITQDEAAAATRNIGSIAGRDARLPAWLNSDESVADNPKYDSAVIIGNGIGSLCCAARLARSKAFAGRVVILGKPPEQSRRLIGGLTLRARSMDYFAACLGIPRGILVEHVYAGHHLEVASDSQRAARFTRRRDGTYEIGKTGEWMSRWDHNGRVLSYDVRNSHMAASIYDFMQDMDIRWQDTKAGSLRDCKEFAPGDNPIIINATPMPLAGAGGLAKKPKNFVIAAQTLFSAPRQREKGILPPNTSFFCGRSRAGHLDASVWYPLRDPLSPSARFYGIFYRTVRAGPGLHKNTEIEIMKDNLFGVANALGFEAVDPDETLGSAMMPCSSWGPINEHTPGYLHLSRMANDGTPIIAGDGMPRAALASYVTAEALIAGGEPQAYLNQAMSGWKQRNRLAHHLFAGASLVTDAGLR